MTLAVVDASIKHKIPPDTENEITVSGGKIMREGAYIYSPASYEKEKQIKKFAAHKSHSHKNVLQ